MSYLADLIYPIDTAKTASRHTTLLSSTAFCATAKQFGKADGILPPAL